MRSRLPLIAVALLLAGLVTFMIVQNIEGYKRQLEKKYQKMAEGFNLVPAVVAAQDITKRGTVFTRDMIKLEQVPQRGLQPYAAQDPLDVIGKEPLGPIKQGQQILTNQLVTPGAGGAALSARIPQGKRAISLPIDLLTGVSGFIRPNDAVDILWTFAFKVGNENQPITLTLFQNVSVLAIGFQMRATGAETPEGQQAMQEAKTVTLALSPQETELLLFASQQGRVQFALRSRADVGPGVQPEILPPASMETLLKQALPAAPPAPEPPPAKQIEIIRGKQKELMEVTPQGHVRPPAPPPSPPPPTALPSEGAMHVPPSES